MEMQGSDGGEIEAASHDLIIIKMTIESAAARPKINFLISYIIFSWKRNKRVQSIQNQQNFN